ncbi:hypothetical protein PR048_012371 [Dryococelus australis]|uniref:Uncharacterized protein n=1 Tax=Dryococelus australis TaxID=614101 RepID=A0ABQ9HPJ2_9NEOP|nr:hypothetical protein PR048_012371 [Dryococelus australis]
MRATTSCKNLVHSILYGNFSTKGTQYGIANEPVVKRKMAEEHGIVAIECGLFVDSGCHRGSNVPSFCRLVRKSERRCRSRPGKYVQPYLCYMSYCAIVNWKPLLRHDSNCYYQVQGQLHLTGGKHCYFVFYTSLWMTHEVIEKNYEFLG